MSNLRFRGGGAKRMKIHRSANICGHTKGGYMAQQLIHKTKSGYTDPGRYTPSLILIKITTCEQFNSTMIDTR